ncbi:MAG: thioredoxin family protein [Bacteroidia bacterium]|nr:thioredoxin family protein [Bacteroidia bacterium]
MRTLMLFCMLGAAAAAAQQPGIRFRTGTWQEALNAARAERKLIFVDAYTEWCGPCKAMVRNTFPNPQVAEYFNAHFINLQLDMEKGEGPAFAARYQVTAYPTLLFINYRGDVVHQALGYRDPAGLANEGRIANDPARNAETLALMVAEGSKEPEVLLRHALNLRQQGKPFQEAAAAYFSTQTEKDLASPANWEAIRLLCTDAESREFAWLTARRSKLAKAYGQQAVEDKIREVLRAHTIRAGLTRSQTQYETALRLAQAGLDDGGQFAARLRMTYAEAQADWGAYGAAASAYFGRYTVTDPKELSRAASLAAAHIQDPALHRQALGWARQSAALDMAFYTQEPYARLLYLLEEYPEALKAAYVARNLAGNDAAAQETADRLIRDIRATSAGR